MNIHKLLLPLLLLTGLGTAAQTDGLSYQAMIISDEETEIPGVDITNAYLSEVDISLRFTITGGGGNVLYQEVQATRTDPYGMVNVIIGQGQPTGESPQGWKQLSWDGSPMDLEVELATEGADYSLFSDQPLLFVPYAYHRNITATGTLTVDGATALHSDLTVDGATDLNSNLTVDGTTDLNGLLFVDGNTYLNNSLDVDGPFTVLSPSTMNGQVTIDAGLTGSENSYGAYALRVQGTEQGMAIRLNGQAQASRNFITFMNGAGAAKGRIEGQTLDELYNSFRFIWDVTMGGFAEAFVLAEGVACSAQLDFAEAGVMAVNAVVAGAQWVELTYDMEANVGVSFASGGADYAEWLERLDPAEHFTPGDVVGVHGGRIAKRTEGAQHLLAISSRPIVLGNMPEEGREHLYERVGFLGQVAVKVAGPVRVGDLIVASGANDGFAVAIPARELPAARHTEVIGVAWEDRGPGAGLVNVAVGMGQQTLAHRVARLEEDLSALRADLDRLLDRPSGDASAPAAEEHGNSAQGQQAPADPSVDPTTMNGAEFEAWLELVGPAFDAAMAEVRDRFAVKGTDYQRFEDVRLMVDTPREALRAMHKGTFLPTLWKSMEKGDRY